MSVLLERDSELAAVRALVGRAASSEGGLLYIEAAAGVGKSSLLTATGQFARGAGFQTLRATGGELEVGHAFGVVRQLLQTRVGRASAAERAELLEGAAAAALPALGLLLSDERTDRFAAYNGLYWLCARLTEAAPVLLLVDDLHWVDRESAEWLAYMARRAHDLPLLLAAATRPSEPGTDPELLAALRVTPGSIVLDLHPLAIESCARLVRTLVPEAEDAFCAACHEATGGNPFYLQELVVEARREGVAPTAAGAARLAELNPAAVGTAVLVRIARLGAAARSLACAVAVLGREAPLRRAAELAELGVPAAEDAADALAAAGILARSRPLSFVHPLIRTAVYDDLPLGVRSQLHRQAARMLAGEGAPAGESAAHLLAVEPAGDPWAADLLVAAADQALTEGAVHAALRLLRRAHLEPPAPEAAAPVLEQLGRAELLAGESAGVAHLLSAMDASSEVADKARIAMVLIDAFPEHPGWHETLARVQQLVEELRDGPLDDDARVLLAFSAVSSAREQVVPKPNQAFTEIMLEHLAGAPQGSAARARIAAWVAHGMIVGATGTASEVVTLAEEALASGTLAPCDIHWTAAVDSLTDCDELDSVDRHIEAAMATARRPGSEVTFMFLMTLLTSNCESRGALREVEAAARAALEVADRWSPLALATTVARARLAQTLARMGRLAEAHEELALAQLDEESDGSLWWNRHLLMARGWVRLEAGDAVGAAADLLRVGQLLHDDGAINPAWWPWVPPAVRALVRLGRAEEARQLAERDLEVARRFGARAAVGRSLTALGIALGDREAALGHLREACDVLAASPVLLDRAIALVELGAALRRAGRRLDARARLREGLDLAVACGAEPLAARAREELGASGARLRRERLAGVESLTPAERRVAQLAARGMTNREIAEMLFLSLKTVEMHLGRTYRKLDVRSREQLPEALTDGVRKEQGPAPSPSGVG